MVSLVSRTKNLHAIINYLTTGKPHNGIGERCIRKQFVNMLPNRHYQRQMQRLLRKRRKNNVTDALHIILAFSQKELDPNDPESIEIGSKIVKEFVDEKYKNRMVLAVWHKDGIGGAGRAPNQSAPLHAHLVVLNADENGRGCTREQQHYKYVRAGIDAIASKYFKLDHGKKTNRYSKAELVKKQKTEQLLAEADNLTEKEKIHLLVENKVFIWKDWLRKFIEESILNSHDEKTFTEELSKRGVSIRKKKRQTTGEAYYTYTYESIPVPVKNNRVRSYKLGYSYSPEAVRAVWDELDKKIDAPISSIEEARKKATETEEFMSWLHDKNKSYIKTEQDDVAIDFELQDTLHEEFLEWKENINNIYEQQEYIENATTIFEELDAICNTQGERGLTATRVLEAENYLDINSIYSNSNEYQKSL